LISLENDLPLIPAKRYFTIGEVSDLCGVKAHVLRYWEQEFTQLRPMKRRGNRRYYQHHEVLMIRRIRDLLYDQGFTICGARNKLQDIFQTDRDKRRNDDLTLDGVDDSIDSLDSMDVAAEGAENEDPGTAFLKEPVGAVTSLQRLEIVRKELLQIRDLLTVFSNPSMSLKD
jgi:DNA-binding transcriptional MerR regulator